LYTYNEILIPMVNGKFSCVLYSDKVRTDCSRIQLDITRHRPFLSVMPTNKQPFTVEVLGSIEFNEKGLVLKECQRK